MNEIKILGIVGSLRKDSYNHYALKAAQERVPDGAVLNLIELHGIPFFNQDDEMTLPATVIELAKSSVLTSGTTRRWILPFGWITGVNLSRTPNSRN